MDNKYLIELIDKLDQSSIAYFDHQDGQYSLTLAKEVPQIEGTKTQTNNEVAPVAPSPEAPAVTDTSAVVEEVETVPTPPVNEGEEVTSPMVGVVYMQPSPEADTYVKLGDTVQEGDVLCLVEAMKLMNEIQAPKSGVISEILVENEEVVEYGQPLFRIQ